MSPQKTCKRCGRSFTVKPRGRPAKLCSSACLEEVSAERVHLRDEATRLARDLAHPPYPTERAEAARQRRITPQTCVGCGTVFTGLTRMYCSTPCYRKNPTAWCIDNPK